MKLYHTSYLVITPFGIPGEDQVTLMLVALRTSSNGALTLSGAPGFVGGLNPWRLVTRSAEFTAVTT